MCNIAGYVGNKTAAPILFDMIKKEEGFAGGYYSGIATIHEGKIYYAKLMGDAKRLLENTNALSLPGNIGIIHSRSKSGGGDSWAHPFVGVRGGIVSEAYVANGSAGKFSVCNEEYVNLAQNLIDEGFEFTSQYCAENKNYQTLDNGLSVHMSDVMCQLIVKNIQDGMSADKAMEKAFCTMPNEIVGLLLSLTEPDKIFFGRINQPMMISFATHGAYLSTTALAFPSDAGKVEALPVNSSGYVTESGFFAKPFEKEPAKVGKISEEIMPRAIEITLETVKEPCSFGTLKRALNCLFEECDCTQNALLGYEVLRILKGEGKIEFIKDKAVGAVDTLTAPRFKIKLKEK